jgi:FixJ family two-component response regulator
MDFKSFFSIYNDLTVQASTLDEFHVQIKHIAKKYQSLTKKELQIAQLIINKYTTKEIALLLSRSTKNIEFSRGEIRKQLKIPAEISLGEFLENY